MTFAGKSMSLDHKIAIGATHLGITRDEYTRHILAGEKWCSGCRAWHPRSDFVRRRSKWDGLDNVCRAHCLERVLAYQARKRKKAGRRDPHRERTPHAD